MILYAVKEVILSEIDGEIWRFELGFVEQRDILVWRNDRNFRGTEEILLWCESINQIQIQKAIPIHHLSLTGFMSALQHLGKDTVAEMTSQPRSTATDEMNTTVHQASQDATGESVEAAASGSFIFNGSGQQTMSTHFSFSATVSSNGSMSASVSSQVTAEGPTVTTVQPQQQPRQSPTMPLLLALSLPLSSLQNQPPGHSLQF
ncbi:hypothetical protein COLO4_05317 [Corchorus olitorius]|uniref:Uncharacterized protein n=1 Tax=Corchorus olitorius TaxID=93759 RepID=A0A1R3KR63_9ROSI|nr:hypothetical protein COLO4_05317 [Corchorus olitorius]